VQEVVVPDVSSVLGVVELMDDSASFHMSRAQAPVTGNAEL